MTLFKDPLKNHYLIGLNNGSIISARHCTLRRFFYGRERGRGRGRETERQRQRQREKERERERVREREREREYYSLWCGRRKTRL